MRAFREVFGCIFLAAFVGVGAVEAQAPAAWRSLAQTQKALGFTEYTWDGDSVCFSNASNVVRFYQGRRRAEVNDVVVWLNAPADGNVKAGDWRIAAVDLDFLVLSILPDAGCAVKPLRVMLDAGHGGMDDGAIARKPVVSEKTLTLDLARRVGGLLEEAGMQVVYTRTNDVAVALDARARMARREAADVFVSIHANFAGNTNACGPETYVMTPAGFPGTPENSKPRTFQPGNANDFHNTLLGHSIHRRLVQVDPSVLDRGLKRQAFFVLREVSCPSVLVEVGFLSNEAETTKMLTPEWKGQCALAIAQGVIEYARKVDALTLAVNERRQRPVAAKEPPKAQPAPEAEAQPEEPRAEPQPAPEPEAQPEEPRAEAQPAPEAEAQPAPEAEAQPEEPRAEPPPALPLPNAPRTVFDFYLRD